MTVEILAFDRERDEYDVLGYVHEGEWIQNDEVWKAPTPFSDQLEGLGLLEDEEALLRKYSSHGLLARKVDPDERGLDPVANSPVKLTHYPVDDGE